MAAELNKKIEELVRFDLTKGYKIGYFHDNRKPGFIPVTVVFAILYILFKGLEHVTGSSWGDTTIGKILLYGLLCSVGAFVISGVINFLKSLPKKAEIDKIKGKREALIRELDNLAVKGNIDPWWKKFDGLNFGISTPGVYGILLWTKSNKVRYENGTRILSDDIICDGEVAIKGQALIDSYIKDRKTSAECRVFPSAECIESDKMYKIADMCFYDVRETLISVEEGLSQEEINEGMRKYREKLDRRERFDNTVRNDRSYTNEEMRYSGQMSQEEYMRRQTDRNNMELYELLDLSQTKTRVTTDGTYTHFFKNGGYLIFDESCNHVVAFMLKKRLDEAELYYTVSPELGNKCEIVRGPVFEKMASAQTPSIMDAFALMKDYLMVAPESLIKPKACSVKEWGTWVYLHYKNIISEEK